MSGLTPAERRGARVLAIILAIGTLTDLHHVRHPRRTPDLAAGPGAAAVESAGKGPSGPADSGRPAGELATASPDGAPPRAGLIDIDTATAAELDRLPGIGPVLAARIVEHRRLHGRFRSADELLSVPGIGPRLLARLKPWLREPAR